MSEISGGRLVSYEAAIGNVFLPLVHEDKFCEFNGRVLFPSASSSHLISSAKMSFAIATGMQPFSFNKLKLLTEIICYLRPLV